MVFFIDLLIRDKLLFPLESVGTSRDMNTMSQIKRSSRLLVNLNCLNLFFRFISVPFS